MDTKSAKGSASDPPAGLAPRERIIAAASDLFYRQGIHATGVDAIAEAAGSNKMTLYRHFESKDLLVAEYLRGLAAQADADMDALERAHEGDPDAKIEAMFHYFAGELDGLKGRGCALANASIELPEKGHPARLVIEDFKKKQRQRKLRLFKEAGVTDPEAVADQIHLLVEGARVSLQSVGPDGPCSKMLDAVRAIIAAHRPKAPRAAGKKASVH